MANFLITGHLLFAVVIIQNPIAQLVESWFSVEDFGLKRVLIRTIISFTCKLQCVLPRDKLSENFSSDIRSELSKVRLHYGYYRQRLCHVQYIHLSVNVLHSVSFL